MSRASKFMAGMGAGLAVGMAAAAGVKMMSKKKKGNRIVKTTNKAVKAVGDIMDNIQDIIG